MSSSSQLLDPAPSSDHLVQFYGGDHGTLVRNVSQFLSEGWRLGEGLLVIATAPHRELLTKQLRKDGVDPVEAVREGRLAWLGAEATLAGIVLEGELSPERFGQFIGGAVQALLAHPGTTRIRAFGELVGMLWHDGRPATAMEVERLWCQLLEVEPVQLFCAYPIDVLGSEFKEDEISPLLHCHTRLVPSITNRPRRRRSSTADGIGTGAAAELLGTTARTLMFYEEEGLIRPKRTARGSRLYSRFDLSRAAMVLRLSRLGFPLRLIKQLAAIRPAARTGREAGAKLTALLESLQLETEGRVAELRALAGEIASALALVRQCASCPRAPTRIGCPECSCELNVDRLGLLQLAVASHPRSQPDS